ncbi:cation:proton antiporter [Streptomyces sp. 4.24]|uniref:cation:proton antiporter domain-containing protein n=1 Tax=Streptomyces tritrimontium TaxID=3406573 RepID=UPI003BB58859
MRGRRFWGALAGTVLVPAAVIGGVAAHFAGGAGGTGGASGAADSVPRLDTTGHFFLAVAVILAAAHLGGRIARRAGQPPVIGEICAGLALGPSLLGHYAPAATGWLFPAPSLRLLDGLAQLGLVLFVFGVGRELAGQGLRGAATQALLVSQASMLVPFAVGAVAATWLLAFAGPRADPLSFVLFVGCALSITALPVLARILSDLDLTRTEPGRLALFAAAVGDGGSWLVLTAVLAGGAPLSVAGVAALALLLLGPVRGGLRRWARAGRDREHPVAVLTVLLVVAVTAAAATTAALGVHQLIGALLVGLAWPVGAAAAACGGGGTSGRTDDTGGGHADRAAERLASTARSVLLPFFFFGFGLSTDLTGLRWDARTASVLAVLLALAVLGKIAGPALCARLTGMAWRPALTVGVLLNARGLTELVVIQIGYQAGVIDRRLLGILTLVALATTAMTSPLLRLLDRPRLTKRARSGARSGGPPSPGSRSPCSNTSGGCRCG